MNYLITKEQLDQLVRIVVNLPWAVANPIIQVLSDIQSGPVESNAHQSNEDSIS